MEVFSGYFMNVKPLSNYFCAFTVFVLLIYMLDIRKNSIYDVYCISRYLYQCYLNNLFWGCLDSAVGRGDG